MLARVADPRRLKAELRIAQTQAGEVTIGSAGGDEGPGAGAGGVRRALEDKLMAVAKIQKPPHLLEDLRTLYLRSMASQWRTVAEQAGSHRQPYAERSRSGWPAASRTTG